MSVNESYNISDFFCKVVQIREATCQYNFYIIIYNQVSVMIICKIIIFECPVGTFGFKLVYLLFRKAISLVSNLNFFER